MRVPRPEERHQAVGIALGRGGADRGAVHDGIPPGLRPYEVQNRLLLPQYRVSRLVQRLAKAGYLRRQAYDGDGRGQLLVLTPEGAEMRRRMWAVYAPAIEQAVGARLSPEEAQTLATLLAKLTNTGAAPAPR